MSKIQGDNPQQRKKSLAVLVCEHLNTLSMIVVIGYFVITWQIALSIKVIKLFALSFLVTSGICYFIIKPFNIFRLLFGLKLINTTSAVAYQPSINPIH